MASVSSAILCDFAQVREGLLMVASGGITRMYRPALPAPMLVMVAAIVEVEHHEIDRSHQLVLSVTQVETAETIVRMTVGLQAASQDLEPGESLSVPVTIDLRSVVLPAYGAFDVKVAVDGEVGRLLTCYVRTPPDAGR